MLSDTPKPLTVSFSLSLFLPFFSTASLFVFTIRLICSRQNCMTQSYFLVWMCDTNTFTNTLMRNVNFLQHILSLSFSLKHNHQIYDNCTTLFVISLQKNAFYYIQNLLSSFYLSQKYEKVATYTWEKGVGSECERMSNEKKMNKSMKQNILDTRISQLVIRTK